MRELLNSRPAKCFAVAREESFNQLLHQFQLLQCLSIFLMVGAKKFGIQILYPSKGFWFELGKKRELKSGLFCL